MKEKITIIKEGDELVILIDDPDASSPQENIKTIYQALRYMAISLVIGSREQNGEPAGAPDEVAVEAAFLLADVVQEQQKDNKPFNLTCEIDKERNQAKFVIKLFETPAFAGRMDANLN